MQIVFLDALTYGEVFDIAELKKYGDAKVYQTTATDQILERCAQATVLISNKVRIDKETIDGCRNLKLICIAATGKDNVDVHYAEKKGITVKNITDYSTNSVAQITFGLMLELLNHTSYHDAYVKDKCYSKSEMFTHLGKPFSEIAGKQVGILGLGNIGRKVAEIAAAFGANVVYHSISGNKRVEKYSEISFDKLVQTSDLISIHSPLNDQTKGLINKDILSKMKPSAVLINAGRGGIIVEEDLATALNNNQIAGAGLDVFTNEPIKEDSPLLHLQKPNKLILSPHIAWASIEARKLALTKIYQHIENFVAYQ